MTGLTPGRWAAASRPDAGASVQRSLVRLWSAVNRGSQGEGATDMSRYHAAGSETSELRAAIAGSLAALLVTLVLLVVALTVR